jgi:putative acyl-CoA dehydrogenase
MAATVSASTHEVLNQSPPFSDVNLFTSDNALKRITAALGKNAQRSLSAFGAVTGSAHAADLARLANEHTPVLRQFDGKGFRLDQVEFHPAWHELMSISAGQGLHCSSWDHLKKKSAKADGNATAGGAGKPSSANGRRAAAFFMASQMENGHTCPITMTNAVVPALLHQEELANEWLPRVLVHDYDATFAPAGTKRAVTFGMGMTEKQGGSDVRSNSTQAVPAGKAGPGKEYILRGHKWFLSAPMCDAFLVLAQAPGGLSCFLLPRFLPDGSQNPLHIMRLKNKMGNRSNASSEVEFSGTHAWMVGEEGRGIPTIISMVTYTRLDCAVSSAGLMRASLSHAMYHCEHRTVFQRKLIDQPLMRQVLADMALDQEAALLMVMRIAQAFDQAEDDPGEAALARIMTPAVKYWICKALPGFSYEAMECLGGNGYVEDGPMARMYREAPLNAIWEGSGNIMCLDVLRAISKEPESLELIFAKMGQCIQGNARLTSAIEKLRDRFANPSGLEADMRYVMENFVHMFAACQLLNEAPDAISDAFISSRIKGVYRHTYGSLRGADVSSILKHAQPNL